MIRRLSAAGLLACLAVLPSVRPTLEAGTVSGPAVVGNGLPNGPGSTLGRIYLRLSDSRDPQGLPSLRIGLVLTSSRVTVEPITCAETASDACEERGVGTAGVLGYPTTAIGSLVSLKLAGATYLPVGTRAPFLPSPLGGSSLELAMEGSFTASSTLPVGSPIDLRLVTAQASKLLAWGAASSSANYASGTGTAILVGDAAMLFFPGWARGILLERDEDLLRIGLVSLEVTPTPGSTTVKPFLVEPDFAAAEAAGLPQGVFASIEIDVTGFPRFSGTVEGAVANDVEVHIGTELRRARFLRGDCNGDGQFDNGISDAVFLLRYIFGDGAEPPCLVACDANDDGQVIGQVTDALQMILYYFGGGDAPSAPFPDCGPEPSPKGVPCAEEPDCP